MNGPATARGLGTLALSLVAIALSATMAWATVNDYDARGRVPAGVSVAGTDLSGMSEPEARDAILRAVSAPLMRPVSLDADGIVFSFDPRAAVEVDVDAMLDSAYDPRRNAAYLTRLMADVSGKRAVTTVQPRYSVDQEVLDAWLLGVARRVNQRAVDASLTVEDSRVRISRSRDGRRLDRAAAGEALRQMLTSDAALSGSQRAIVASMTTLKPRVTEEDFGKTIVVDVSERRIRLYDGATLEKTYPCAVGTPGYPTPKGVFEIVLKRYMPTWVNPAPNGWGADMPASIPPGPGNPLGTRALNLSAPGIRFHGTTKTGSIGTAASHGCMRMLRSDIEDFYERVEVGTAVYIVD